MLTLLKNLLFNFTLNGFLFIFLMISIQNSASKNKVNLIFTETIYLPTSFIIGSGFISGSIIGNLLFKSILKKEKNLKRD